MKLSQIYSKNELETQTVKQNPVHHFNNQLQHHANILGWFANPLSDSHGSYDGKNVDHHINRAHKIRSKFISQRFHAASKTISAFIQHQIEKYKTQSELNGLKNLSDNMLKDIGLTRFDLGHISAENGQLTEYVKVNSKPSQTQSLKLIDCEKHIDSTIATHSISIDRAA